MRGGRGGAENAETGPLLSKCGSALPGATGRSKTPMPDAKSLPSIPPPGRGTRQLRKGRQSIPGHYYFLTANLHGRRSLFHDPASALIVKASVDWMEANGRWTWVTYVLMPDHIHLVVRLAGKSDLAKCMMTFKGFTGKRLAASMPPDTAVWQRGYFDHHFRSDEKFYEVLFYVYWNPVRAGLAEPFATDYPHWDCREPYRSRMIEDFPRLRRMHESGRLWKPDGDE